MAKRECLLDQGFTEDEVTEIENKHGLDTNGLTKAIAEEEFKIRQAKLQAIAIKNATDIINAHPKGTHAGLQSLLTFDTTGVKQALNVENLTDFYARYAFREMDEMMAALMPKVSDRFYRVDEQLRSDIVREVYKPGTTKNQEAAKYARTFEEVNEKMRLLHNKLGGNIKKDKHWFMPQSHNSYKIRNVSKEQWVDFLLDDRLDYRSMWNDETKNWFTSNDELRTSLNNMYDNVTQEGAQKLTFERAKYHGMMTETGMVSRDRFLRFKDGDAWLEYQKLYGEPDMYSSMLTHMQGLARETAMVQVFGPNPGAAFYLLSHKARLAKGANARLLKRAENTWLDLSGQLAGKNGKLQAWSERIRSVMTMKLGAAVISAFADQGTIHMVSKINGIPAFKAHMKWLQNLSDGKEKQFLLQSGVNASYLIDVTSGFARFADTESFGKLGKFSDRYLRMTGLNASTEAGQVSMQLSTLGHLANVDKLKWDELSHANKRMLEEFNFTEADWKVMSSSKKQTIKGARFLDMRELPFEMQQKVSNMMDTLSYRAIPAPNAEVRAIMRQGLPAGDLPGEMMRVGTQFKSFGISILLYHVNYARGLSYKGENASAVGYLAGMFVMTTMLGAAAVQAKRFVAGKEPLDTSTPEFWVASVLQGGGIGIFADFMFRDYTRYGSSFYATLAGPAASTVENVVRNIMLANTQRAVKAAITGDEEFLKILRDTGTASVEEIRRNLPTQAWYAKLLFEKWVFQTTNQMIDPDYINKLHRREARQIQDTGAGNWYDYIEVR